MLQFHSKEIELVPSSSSTHNVRLPKSKDLIVHTASNCPHFASPDFKNSETWELFIVRF